MGRTTSSDRTSSIALLLCLLAMKYELLCNGQRCQPCESEWFAFKECSLKSGTQCKQCSNCSGEGKFIVSKCKYNSNIVCGCTDGYNMTSTGDCKKHVPEVPSILDPTEFPLEPREPMDPMGILAIVIMFFVLMVLFLFMVLMWCRKNIYNQGEHQKLPHIV
ncbi:hypothetical protein DPEC_G00213630 [Dallia pectoralis]|uniref:Uncharacterized protein n=1 Tax=Dallia pectoralis TaxID=75939 RepID=A0ACC2G692_DALPE|nr:hypothetical protein DPEC_G00213630 [Dallia pectoralis]